MDKNSVLYLQEKFKKVYGESLTEQIFSSFSLRRKTTLRINTIKSSLTEVTEVLKDNGIDYTICDFCEYALILNDAKEDDIRKLQIYQDGKIYLQNLSSLLPTLLLDPKSGEDILDMAAAPGGKTTHICALTGNTANVTACEFNKARAEKLSFNLQKQGATRVNLMVTDSRNLSDFFSFDKILLDAPCSGSGTIDLNDNYSKACFNDKTLKTTTSLQLALIKKAIKLLKKGGTLIYSTCSILKEENEHIVKEALKFDGIQLQPIDRSYFNGCSFLPCDFDQTITIMPDEIHEGFFVAKIKKIK